MNLAFAEARILAEEFGVWERAVELGSTTLWSVLYWAHEQVEEKLVLCIAQSNAASCEKRRRAERRAR